MNGASDAAGEPLPPRAFAVGYQRNGGDMLVYGGGVLILVGVFAALANDMPALLALSLAGAGLSFHFLPMIERRPQLGVSSRGLYVERIGVIGWRAIADLRLRQTAIRTIEFSYLDVVLRFPLEQSVVTHEHRSPLRRLMTSNWRRTSSGLELRLDTLSLPPADLYHRVRTFFVLAQDDPAHS